MLGMAALVVVLVTRNPRVAFWQALPTVLAMLMAGGATASVLVRRCAHPVWVMLLPALAAWLATIGTIALLATIHGRAFGPVFARPVVERGLMGAPLLGALVGASLLLLERSRQRELVAYAREAMAAASQQQLQREKMQAQLQLLQAQVEPHFLYNTLANLRQLVRLDSERALAMLDHLIRYFKLVLPSFHVERQALADELALVQTYIELLRERMDRPMRLSIDVPAAWQSFQVPPGALLCLVENAVKHGRPDDGSELHVLISAGRDGAQLRLAVQDNGAGPRPGSRPGGTGLANLRERMRLQYGDAASLQLHAARPGCEAVIHLPVETT